MGPQGRGACWRGAEQHRAQGGSAEAADGGVICYMAVRARVCGWAVAVAVPQEGCW
jgi:hypothetical protein